MRGGSPSYFGSEGETGVRAAVFVMGEEAEGTRVCMDGWLGLGFLLGVCRKIGHTEGTC